MLPSRDSFYRRVHMVGIRKTISRADTVRVCSREFDLRDGPREVSQPVITTRTIYQETTAGSMAAQDVNWAGRPAKQRTLAVHRGADGLSWCRLFGRV